MLKLSEFRGVYIWEATEVLLFIYVGDILLAGETIIQLQRKITILETFCRKYGIKSTLIKQKSWLLERDAKQQKEIILLLKTKN